MGYPKFKLVSVWIRPWAYDPAYDPSSNICSNEQAPFDWPITNYVVRICARPMVPLAHRGPDEPRGDEGIRSLAVEDEEAEEDDPREEEGNGKRGGHKHLRPA